MTTRQRYDRLARILMGACELPPGEQSAFLERECAADRSLRAEAEALLENDAHLESFLDNPAFGDGFSIGTSGAWCDEGAELVGTRIGHYRLTRVIATGGMGTVFEAVQENPNRIVAVKVMRHGIASRSALRRFEHEGQILARLHHPGIAEIHEAGTHDPGTGGVPYFVMEYVPGARSITAYAREEALTTRERLGLFVTACRAVHHGHQKGIIHRDLKPANILVDGEGQIKVIDFGVARATDADLTLTTPTDVGQLLGTLQYMSPEQCEADLHELDTRSDVYALGVVLYELLCEQLPYDVTHAPVPEASRVIHETSPARPSTISRALRGDVETIVLKALAKERDQRYGSAAALGQDIVRFLSGDAIIARAPSVAYQLRVLVRRHRAASGALAALLLVLLTGVIVTTVLYLRALEARNAARKSGDSARERQVESEAVTEFLTTTLASIDPIQGDGRELTVLEALDRAAKTIATAFPDRPLVEAAVRTALGQTYAGLLERESAEPHLRAALEIRRRLLGEEDPITVESMLNLACVLGWLSEDSPDHGIERRTVELSRRVWGEEHPKTLHALVRLRFPDWTVAEKTEPAYRDRVGLFRHVLGDAHPDTLDAMRLFSEWLDNGGRHAESLELYEEILETQRRVLGNEHPDTLETLHNLAWHLHSREVDQKRAEQLFRELLTTRRRLVGTETMDVTWSLLGLGFVLWAQGHPEEAEAPLREAVEIRTRIRPADDLHLALSKAYLGHVMTVLGRYDEAEPLLLESYPIVEARRQWEGQLTNLIRIMIDLYESWGKPTEAALWQARLEETEARLAAAGTLAH